MGRKDFFAERKKERRLKGENVVLPVSRCVRFAGWEYVWMDGMIVRMDGSAVVPFLGVGDTVVLWRGASFEGGA